MHIFLLFLIACVGPGGFGQHLAADGWISPSAGRGIQLSFSHTLAPRQTISPVQSDSDSQFEFPPLPVVWSWMWRTNVSVGTPAQVLSLEIDTGWNQLVLPTYQGDSHQQFYDPATSSTSAVLKCSTAKEMGITCVNCPTPSSPCFTDYGSMFSGVQFGWVEDVISFLAISQEGGWSIMASGSEKSQSKGMSDFRVFYNASMLAQDGFSGNFGVSLPLNQNGSALDPTQPPATHLLSMLKEQGLITRLMYSFCVNHSSRHGLMQFGSLLPAQDFESDGPLQWAQMQVIEAWLDDLLLWRASPGMPGKQVGLDSGSFSLRMPAGWSSKIRSELEASCERRPLHGLCDVPLNQTVFDLYCYPFTAADMNDWPIIRLVLPPPRSTPGADPVVLEHRPLDYLFSPGVAGAVLPGMVGCDSTARLAAWTVIPEDPTDDFVVIGEEVYRNYVCARDYEAPGGELIGFAPIITCGSA